MDYEVESVKHGDTSKKWKSGIKYLIKMWEVCIYVSKM